MLIIIHLGAILQLIKRWKYYFEGYKGLNPWIIWADCLFCEQKHLKGFFYCGQCDTQFTIVICNSRVIVIRSLTWVRLVEFLQHWPVDWPCILSHLVSSSFRRAMKGPSRDDLHPPVVRQLQDDVIVDEMEGAVKRVDGKLCRPVELNFVER